jgi:NAD(P)H-hydrate epimerase
MKILKSSQIREVDSYTIENEPIKSIDLMERAAMTITAWISQNISIEHNIKIFAGPGNNGGDALALARQLLERNYKPEVYLLKITDQLSADCQINLDRLKAIPEIHIHEILKSEDFPVLKKDDILVDGLFGSGLSRKLEGLPHDLVQHLNKSGCKIIAIDIPSGLFGENNDRNHPDDAIKANHTLSFQLPKLAFMFPGNYLNVGEWEILPIGLNADFINKQESDYYLIDEALVQENIICREKFSHKGSYGHVLLVAGSYGKMGAAILGAHACLRAGAGLVTVHIPKIAYQIMQTALPEAMISIDWSEVIISNVPDVDKYTAIGVGPGIGTKNNTQKALEDLFDKTNCPMVIDADALNILAEKKELLTKIPKHSILTPHPKEFERLVGKTKGDYERMQIQKEFAQKHHVYVVLKGAHTSIACPDGEIHFNNTGNPGMATAGSGDVLTGMILALLGQAYHPKLAAIMGVYLHGLSADVAVKNIGQEALIASDIIHNIGKAFLKLKK